MFFILIFFVVDQVVLRAGTGKTFVDPNFHAPFDKNPINSND